MATANSETQAHAADGPTFLGLPPEVRNMIYRLLLVADKPLNSSKKEHEVKFPRKSGLAWASLGEYHLQPAILRVCWQLYREASPILNCENTLGIRIRTVAVEDRGTMSSFRCSVLTDGLSSFWDSSMDKFQRFEIVILEAWEPEVRPGVEELCRCYLSKSHALQHVSIHLLEAYHDIDHTILGPFGALRNLRSVDIHGAPLPYAEPLRRLMLGNTPPDDLDGMYHELEKYVKALKGDRRRFRKAMEATRTWDVQKFKEIRSKILSDIQDRIDRALLHMFDFDPHSAEDQQGTNVTVEVAMEMLKMIMDRKLKKTPRKIEAEHDGRLGDH
ncbi:hypothetical protein MMC22_001567 [Lobaria immixta]|nr:hypothetical protein [Lobaria immixta]